MATIVTASRFTPAPGRSTDLAALLTQLQASIREELGTLRYDIHHPVDPTSDTVLVIQSFASEAAFRAHAAHMVTLDAPQRLAALLNGELTPPELFRLAD